MTGMKIITLIIYKMYAELIGNYKNYRIKSLQDNILMAELADEELSGIVPRIVEEDTNNEWQDIGYYKDSDGKVHYGVIPKNDQQSLPGYKWQHQEYDPSRNRTSNPRYYYGSI